MKKETKADRIENFLVSDTFKKPFTIKKKQKNKMTHLTPKKKKRK
jgi:hypothetical protein